MTLRIVLLPISLPLLALGGHGLYHVSRNPAQTSVTCQQFLQQRPSAAWLRISGCQLDYVGAGYRESRGEIAELYFPVRVAESEQRGPVQLVAVTNDPQALAIAQNTIGGGRQADQEAFLVMMLRIVTTLQASREIEGTIRTSPLQILSTRRALEGMGADVAPGAAVMDLHARPNVLWPAIQAGAGLLGLIAFLLLQRRARARAAGSAAPIAATPATAAATSAAGDAPIKLPALMLLNLPHDAAAADIETAPPLGRRKDVMKRLKRAIKGVKFAGTGGTLTRKDASIRIDLGEADPVPTAVLRGEGAGAAAIVRSILEQTGWRAFVPKRGAFVGPDQIDEVASS